MNDIHVFAFNWVILIVSDPSDSNLFILFEFESCSSRMEKVILSAISDRSINGSMLPERTLGNNRDISQSLEQLLTYSSVSN